MDATPEVEVPHHHKTGNRKLDLILAVSAFVISLVSVFLAIENAVAMRHLVASNSWPFVNVGVSDGNEAGNAALDLVIQNKGIGPAKIESLEVFYGGQPMRGGNALIHAMTGGKSIPFVRSRVVGSVLSAKESVNFLSVVGQSVDPSDLLKLAKLSKGIAIRTCYCSVFDECWLLDRTIAPSKLTEVDECPAAQVPFQV
ncbi:MAG TPA: hypothetical protein VGQ93_00025 [Lysobacter sp.]|jgi:hypothetical protein|nr:hypothetical protein [Lysobacter sp.]